MTEVKTAPSATKKTGATEAASTVNEAIATAIATVKAAKEPKPRKPVIEVVSAIYGAEGKTVDFAGNCKIGQKLTNKMVGSDPLPKKVKTATVVIKIEGKLQEPVEIKEGEKITSENWDLSLVTDPAPTEATTTENVAPEVIA